MRRVQPYLPQDVRRARQIESTFPGTMGGTLITSPVRRRYPAKQPRMAPGETCPTPWAWYRGDDILNSVEGSEVTFWEDRTTNTYDLDDSMHGAQSPYPLYTLDAVGGHPGVKRTASSNVELAATYDASPVVFDEVSVLWVVQAPDSGSLSLRMQPVDVMEVIDLIVYKDWIEAWAGGGYADAPHASPVCSALMVQSSTEVRLWINGTEVTYNSRVVPSGQSQSYRHIPELNFLAGSATEARFAELKIWNVALSDECIAEEHTYVTGRYGL